MTKKILVGLIAALMLFAFVACDNSTPSMNYNDKTVVGLGYRITGDTTYLEGEDFDFRGMEFVLKLADGTTTPVANSDLYASAISSGSATVSYLGSSSVNDNPFIVTVPVTVEEVDSYTVTGTLTKVYANIGGATSGEGASATEPFDESTLTVTAYSADKSLSRVLGTDEFVATYDASKAGEDVAISVKVGATEINSNATTPYKVDVEKDSVTNFSVAPKADKYFYVDGSKVLTDNFDFTFTWASGEDTVEGYTPIIAADTTTANAVLRYDDTNVTSNSGKFVAADITNGWYTDVYLASNESISKQARLTVYNTYKSISEVTAETTTVSLVGQSITKSMFDVTAITQTNAEAIAVTNPDHIKLSLTGSGDTTGLDSIPVSHIYDAETNPTMSVYVGISMNNQPIIWNTQPTSVRVVPAE